MPACPRVGFDSEDEVCWRDDLWSLCFAAFEVVLRSDSDAEDECGLIMLSQHACKHVPALVPFALGTRGGCRSVARDF
jgi:hypothetical protein